jgi:hypothetical protein
MTTAHLDSPLPISAPVSTARVWAARICAALAIAFLIFDTTLKVLMLGPAVQGTTELGFPADSVPWIGLIELGCLALYLVPRTAPIGAILFTGYLGGAIATHMRLENPLLSHTLFPLYVAVLMWLPLYLRDPRVRALVSRAAP